MEIEYRTEPEYWEYLDGEAHPKVSPDGRHTIVQATMAAIMRRSGQEHGHVGIELDVRLADHERLTKFIPDVSFSALERQGEVPDIAIEVLSPGDSRIYLEKKIALYLTHGSLVVLDVDPIARTIRVYDRASRVTTLREGQRFIHVDVPWLTFGVREAFADLDK